MASEELATIQTDKPEEAVYKEIEEALVPLGQTSVTRKGTINLRFKSSYGNFLSNILPIEGSIRKQRDGGRYDITFNYGVGATTWCWVLSFLLLYLAGPLLLLVPYVHTKKKIQAELQKAILQAKRELEV